MSNKVAVFRREHFNAAHRLYNPQWDQARNEEVFGKCAWPHFHGHNYELEVRVVGVPDPETGYVMDMKRLSDLIQREILGRFDHRNLNLDTEEFRHRNPTAENIAVVIFDLLRPHIDPSMDLRVRLYETPRNFVEYPVD
ncbi:MAG TPA: 6-carboxytetrahydropterin synthase [Chitinophagaceae bacterium]|nr:6-carboxytetrahydropterin synthase [Chitinophagaceae bacterium]